MFALFTDLSRIMDEGKFKYRLLSLNTTPLEHMAGVEEQLHLFLTSALDGGASAKYQSELNPWVCLRGRFGLEDNNCCLVGNTTPVVKPIISLLSALVLFMRKMPDVRPKCFKSCCQSCFLVIPTVGSRTKIFLNFLLYKNLLVLPLRDLITQVNSVWALELAMDAFAGQSQLLTCV